MFSFFKKSNNIPQITYSTLFCPENNGIRSHSGKIEFEIYKSWITQATRRIYCTNLKESSNFAMQEFTNYQNKNGSNNIKILKKRWEEYGLTAYISYQNRIKAGRDYNKRQEVALDQLPSEIAKAVNNFNSHYEELQKEYSPLIHMPIKEVNFDFLKLVEKSDPETASMESVIKMPFKIFDYVIEIRNHAIATGIYNKGSETIEHYISSTITFK